MTEQFLLPAHGYLWGRVGSAQVGSGDTGLELTDDPAELARCEKSGPERARSVLADGWKGSEGGPDLCRHVGELPADLVVDRFWPIGGRQAGGLRGIPGGAQRVRAHVADADRLAGGSSSGDRCRSLHFVRAHASYEATSYLLGRAELSPGERAGPGDECPRAPVIWHLRLEEAENSLCAVGGPLGEKTPVGLAQRLWRPNHPCSS